MENRKPLGWSAFGAYWPRGAVLSRNFRLTDSAGRSVPVQSETAARWPDGSLKWTRHFASAEALGQEGSLTPAEAEPVFPEQEAALGCAEDESGWTVTGSGLRIRIPKSGPLLAEACEKNGTEAFRSVRPVLRISHESRIPQGRKTEVFDLPGEIRGRRLESAGPLEVTFRFDGVHPEGGQDKMPFRIRMSIRQDGEIRFDDTFFFQGDPAQDRLAGWGLRLETCLKGRSYQRHIRFLTDGAVYHDNPTQLMHWRKRLNLLSEQQRGETVPADESLDAAAAELPRWDHFRLTQHSAWHYSLFKKAWEDGCWLEGPQGKRAPGAMAVSDPERTLSLHIRDFWEKHPAGLETEGLSESSTFCTAWFYDPGAEAFDFRHYDRRSYPQGTYEGFDYSLPDPNGIAVTCQLTVRAETGYVSDDELKTRNEAVRRPAVYLADPDYYHANRAFGPWGLPRRETETGRWIEDQITAACDFYLKEADERSWYGLFSYGDFMHTYEAARHQWRWDVGGYAWDNTELAPTYWLWLQFLRTGSERVFRLAEALSRHAADVDMYHFGPMKGLGSRHNVRHWGCPCKEPRVSMAGHHRPLFYLTGDRRIGDCMEDSLQAGESLEVMPWYLREDGKIHLRSGPDWAALLSNWMTAYERTSDPVYREMAERGIADLKQAPLGLTSGPEFAFDPKTGHLEYCGEAKAGVSMHLQACMGETEIWLEAAEMLENRDLADMTARNGRYFFLSPEECLAESNGLLEGRRFGSPIYSAEMQAWAAKTAGDAGMARNIWQNLLGLLFAEDRSEGFRSETYGIRADGTELSEIPWITTNFTAQWCLKAIVCLDLIPEGLPKTLAELAEALRLDPSPYRLYGA